MTSRTPKTWQQVDWIRMLERSSAADTPDTSHWHCYFKSDGFYIVDDAGTEYGPLTSGLMTELGADPSTPATGDWQVYFKSDGIYIIDDAGTVTGPLIGEDDITFSGASLSLSGDMTLGTGGNTSIDWDVEDYDTDSFHEGVTNPDRFTVPEDGYYAVSVNVAFVGGGGGSTGIRRVRLVKNGTVVAVAQDDDVPGTATTAYTIARDFSCSASDYFHIAVYQSNGIDVSIESDYTNFCIKKVG